MQLLLALLLLVAAIPLVLALVRANELFYVRLRGGKLRLVRGRIPHKLLSDMGDILRRPDPGEVTLRGVSEDRQVRLYAEGELTDAQRQQLRNVIGPWQVSQIRNAPRR